MELFRALYRPECGTSVQNDPLYESVSAGRRSAGMEHWLPLFYETLETIFDYLPGAAVSLDHQAEEVRADRLATIADFYAARLMKPAPGAPAYRAIKPELLYLDDQEWIAALDTRRVTQISPFAAPAAGASFDAGAAPGHDFAAGRPAPHGNLLALLRPA